LLEEISQKSQGYPHSKINSGSYLECVIDVQEIKKITGKNSKTFRDVFYRLKKRGFFLEFHSFSNGMRVIPF